MELRHLEYFVTVAEERHFTRAANRLLVSQSGLSASIRALERELGAALFVRSTRRVELTEVGRAVLTDAQRALASAAAAKDAAAAVRGLLRGTFAIGTEQCIGGIDVPATLARFRAAHPGVEVRLRHAGALSLVDELAAGRLDLAVLALDEAPDGLALQPLASEPMVLLCHPQHPLHGSRPVHWSELTGETFVDFHLDWGIRQLNDRAFASAGTVRRVALEVNDVHSLLELVGHRLGAALVPRPFANKAEAAGLIARPLAEGTAPHWRVSIAVSSAEQASPAAQAFREILATGAVECTAGEQIPAT